MSATDSQTAEPSRHAVWTLFLTFLRLGLTSFGGPIAHLGYFRDEFVVRRRWFTEHDYADVVALCQFLPGPASSQVGMAIGLSRAGFPGALAAWAGFTLPSAIALVLFALTLTSWSNGVPASLIAGLKIVAVAVIAQAVWGMARTLCPDRARATLAAIAAGIVLLVPAAWAQVAVMAAAGLIGWRWLPAQDAAGRDWIAVPVRRPLGAALLFLFAALLAVLPVAASLWPDASLALFDVFYRAGALVFGGGHVVLPLLQAAVVPNGWVGNDAFLAGYGAAQAVPGPLFTFAAFLGAAAAVGPGGWVGGLVCLLAIFLPAFLLVAGALPFWARLRGNASARSALAGVNAAVVGVLLAALYNPVWTSAIHRPVDFVLALAAFVALVFWKIPPWLVVLGCGLGGWLLLP